MRRSASSRGRRTRRCAGGCSTSDRSRAALTSRSAAGDHTILALRPRDLAVLGLIENRAAVLVAAVVGLLWETGMLERAVSRVGIDVAGRGVLRRLFVSIFRDGTLPFDDILRAGAAIVGLLIVLRILSVIWAIVRLYGFRLTLAGADLRTEYGLITRVSATVPLHRIQTLTIRRGLIHRWFDRASVKVETAGGQAAGDAAGQPSRAARVAGADHQRARSCPRCSASFCPTSTWGNRSGTARRRARSAASYVRGWCSR